MKRFFTICALILKITLLTNCRNVPLPQAASFRDGSTAGDDTSAPQIVSVTGESGSTQILIEFSEAVFSTATGTGILDLSDFNYQDNNATGATNLASVSDGNGADRLITLEANNAFLAGDNGDRIVFPAGAVFDASGNALATTDRPIVITSIPPTVMSAETMDTNSNGKIDHYKITFSRNMNDSTFPGYANSSTLGAVTPEWRVAGFGNVRIDPTVAADADNDQIIYITWEEGPVGTGLKPEITTSASPGLQATNGSLLAQINAATILESDGVPPGLIEAIAHYTTSLHATFSEPVYTNLGASGALTAADFVYTDSAAGGATTLVGITESDGSDSEIVLTLDNPFTRGDATQDTLAPAAAQIFDAAGNHAGGTAAIRGAPTVEPNQMVRAAVQVGSTTYIGGYFTHLGYSTGQGVIVYKDGGKFANVPVGKVNGAIYVAEPDGMGGVYIGGSFTQVGAISRNRIARINSDGSLHPFDANANNTVRAIVVTGDSVYVGGSFTSIGGQARTGIALLYAATELAQSWNANCNNVVQALAISGNTLYVGGDFTAIGGQSRNRLAAVDTGTAIASSWNPNAQNSIKAIVLSGGNVYVAGTFTSVGGQTRNRIAAIDAATGLAISWNPDANAEVTTLAVSGTTVYAGGFFTLIGGQARNRIAAIDSTTGLVSAWNPDANSIVSKVLVSGSKVYMGGSFTQIGAVQSRYLAVIDTSTGTADSAFPSTEASVFALADQGSRLFSGALSKLLTHTHAITSHLWTLMVSQPHGIRTQITVSMLLPIQQVRSMQVAILPSLVDKRVIDLRH